MRRCKGGTVTAEARSSGELLALYDLTYGGCTIVLSESAIVPGEYAAFRIYGVVGQEEHPTWLVFCDVGQPDIDDQAGVDNYELETFEWDEGRSTWDIEAVPALSIVLPARRCHVAIIRQDSG